MGVAAGGTVAVPAGIAIICGKVSGLEVLDFDAPEMFDSWCAIIEEAAPGALDHCPVVQTPKG